MLVGKEEIKHNSNVHGIAKNKNKDDAKKHSGQRLELGFLLRLPH